MYNDILFPTDGGETMAIPLRHAIHQAKVHDATLHILHVVDSRSLSYLTDEVSVQVLNVLEENGQRTLEEVSRIAGEKVDCTTNLSHGIPHEEILLYANQNDIDLIVMGGTSENKINSDENGETANKILSKNSPPVLTTEVSAKTSIHDIIEGSEEDRPEYLQ